ncbi:MAG: methyltransferase [Cyanobacteriota bacterium]
MFAYLARKAVSLALPQLPCRDWRPSAIASVEDDPSTQNFPAMMLVLDALRDAATLQLDLASADAGEAVYFNSFPGDHYRLIAALVRCIQPKYIVEIGTYTGMATRVLLDHSPSDACVVTYDLLPWNSFRSHLSAQDFNTGRVQQRLVNLADPDCFSSNLEVLQQAEFIFLDAPKDGHFEPTFLHLLAHSLQPASRPRYLLVDDIRLLNMVTLWRAIASPKLDLTSFAHWSGTGLVDLRQGLTLKVDAIA